MTRCRPVVLSGLLLAACSGKETPPAAPPPVADAPVPEAPVPEAPVTEAPVPEAPKAPPSLVHGTLSRAAGGWTFTAAGAAPVPVPPAVAAIADQAVGPEAEGASGLLVAGGDGAVLGWRCIGLDAGPCRPPTDGVSLALHGTEPFWALRLFGDRAVYTEMDGPAPLPLTGGAGDGPWTLTPEGGGAPWTVRRVDGPCSDGMADVLYTFGVEVDRGAAVALRGCALDLRPPG